MHREQLGCSSSMETSRATTGQVLRMIIFYSLSGTMQARRHARLLPLVGQTSSVEPEEPRGSGEETRGKEAEQVQRDKEKEMEANIRV